MTRARTPSASGRVLRLARAIAAGLAALIVILLLLPPPGASGIRSHPDPARGFTEALRGAAKIEARDTRGVNPECRTRLMTHGVRTRDALVLIHGLTNCPRQFETLAARFHARGWNVLVARIPHHGLADRMTEDLGQLDAIELARFTDELIDVAAGLGERVTIAGLSLGGVAAAWAGQERPDVHRAVAIAPMFGVAHVPRTFTGLLARALLAIPDRFVWWDSKARERLEGPRQVYPRFSTRAIGEILRLGFAVQARASRDRPAATTLSVVSVGGDPAVDNGASAAIVARWKRSGARVDTYEFPRALGLDHDLIDPEQVGARIDLVYPELERIIAP